MPYADHETNLTYQRDYRAKNRERLLLRASAKSARYIRWTDLLKNTQGCFDCGIRDLPLVYHHIDPATKLFAVASMCSHSLESWFDEVCKCVVLCASCHSKRHATGNYTHGQQSKKRSGCSSQYRGVGWHRATGKWAALIWSRQSKSHIGVFANEVDAARAYDLAAIEAYGPNAITNFPCVPDGLETILEGK